MHAAKVQIHSSDHIGLFAVCTDAFALAPPGVGARVARSLEDVLGVRVVRGTVAGSPLLGLFCAANSKGIVVPSLADEREVEALREALGVRVGVAPGESTAIGNLVLANDRAAVADARLGVEALEVVRDALRVPLTVASFPSVPLVGSLSCATNRGAVVSSEASEEDLDRIEAAIRVPVEVGTVNRGTPYVGTGLLANSRGFVVGKETTGPELARIDEALGFI